MNEVTATHRVLSAPAVKRPGEGAPKASPQKSDDVQREGGKPVPVVGKPKPVEVPTIETKAAVEQLNQYLKDSHRSLEFEISKDLGRTIIRVVNPVTKEVIREIPPDAARIMAASVERGNFNLLDTLV